ncbi:putative ribonuclease H-like domain-containing protein [Tanacetum coccineum]
MNRSVFKCTAEDYINKPLYNRFTKTNSFKGVPHPLTGDYTPKPQEEINDSLYVYGKKGPQKPKISDSYDNSTDHSTCQSNDSEGSCGNTSEHSSESESESISVTNEMSTSKSVITNEKVMSESKEVEHSYAKHVKTPRQQMKNQRTSEVKGKNWNKMMERELGEGYSFIKKKCFICGSLSHLIKDCDYYEKKMAREAEFKKQRVFNTGNRVTKPVWTNAKRVNHANHFVPRPVQLNVVRQNDNYVRPNVNTGRVNVNSVRHNVNSIRSNVNTGRSKQLVPTCNSNSFSPVRPQDHPLKNMEDRGIFDSGCSGYMTGNKDHLDDFEEYKGGSVTFGGSKGYITGKGRIRIRWVFCLATNDETNGILQNFIRQIENQLNHKVKIIRSDNGTEFKNMDMLEFCGNKGIKQEYSNARTPQQNGVAERMNRTLIEAARTMLADSLLPTTFWAEAVSTACYIFNRVRVTKPQNKTPYELLFGHKPIISYIRPFGCHVTILDTLSVLGKFDGKCDEGFLVGYSLNSKAFRVYNLVTKKVEVNLHVKFLEEKPNVKGVGYRWMFDIDYLTDSMNYIPVSLDNQSNPHAGTSEVTNSAGTLQSPNANASEEADEDEELIVVPTAIKHSAAKVGPRKSSTNSKEEKFLTELQNLQTQEKEAFSTGISEDTPEILAFRRDLDQLAQKHLREVTTDKATSTNSVNSGSEPANTQPADQDDSDMLELTIFNKPHKGIFDKASYDDEGMVHDFNNLPTEVAVSPTPTLRIHNIHPQDQILGDPKSSVQTRSRVQQTSRAHALEEPKKIFEALKDDSWVEAMQEELLQFKLQQVYVSQPPGFVNPDHPKKVYKVVKALYGLHQAPRAWYATLSTFLEKHRYRRGTIDKTLFIKKDKKDIMLVQVYVDDIIFGSTRKSWCDEFEALMKGRFQMSSMGELIFFLGLQVKQKTDGIFISQDKYVADMLKKFDLASVTPKTSHLNAVKRIFKYLKGKPNLGLWYPRESSFDLEAFSDSDYAGANLDRKSITGGCQFLGSRLISWQCKKQTIVATSTTEAEYVAAASCCGQVLWIQNQMLDYGFNFMNTKIHIDNESTICIVKNPVYHSKTKHIEIRHHFIRDSYEKKLIRVEKIHTQTQCTDLLDQNFFDGPRFNFPLLDNIWLYLDCIGAWIKVELKLCKS